MKNRIKVAMSIFAIAIVSIFISEYSSSADGYSTGAPAGYCGDPAGGGITCTSCHTGPVTNPVTGWITSNIPLAGYTAGDTYTITAMATGVGHTKFGFEISPQNSGGNLLGTLINTGTATQLVGSNEYITHTSSGTTGTSGHHTWTFNWTAPTTGKGPVTFYGAFNITNDDGSSSGDTIYTTTTVVSENIIVSVAIAASTTNTICNGTSVTFTATPTNGGTGPAYQWQVNGSNVGTNSATYTTSKLANGDNVTCILTSNKTGVSGNPATSNQITMTVNPLPTATISGTTSVCQNSSDPIITFTGANGTAPYTFTYSINGGANQTTSSSNVNNSATISAPTSASGTLTYALVSIQDASSTTCSQSQTGNAIVTVNPTLTPSVSIVLTGGTNPTCSGQLITFTADPINGGTIPAYQWTVNGTNVGTDSTTYTSTNLANGDTIKCVLTSDVICANTTIANSNSIIISSTTSLIPSITIAPVSGTNSICVGTSVTFTANTTGGGTTPSYQWILNGGNVGTNSPTYTTASLTNGQIISCSLTSNSPCANPKTAISDTITMIVNTTVTPSISIGITGGANPTNAGEMVTFTATPTNGGTTPVYQWQVDGGNVGTNSPIYTTTGLTNGQVVTCTLTSNAPCTNSSTAASNAISMTIITPPAIPTISVTLVNGAPTITSSSATGNQWYLNGTLIPGDTNQTITVTQNGNYTDVITTNGLSSAASMPANIVIPPTPTITNPLSGTQLVSSSATGNQWYYNGTLIPGDTSQTLMLTTISKTGNYTVIVTVNGIPSTSSAAFYFLNTGIDEINNDTFFNVYPNPNDGNFSVTFNVTTNANYKLELKDMLGQTVYQELLTNFSGSYSKQLSIADYGKGMYMINLTNNENQTIKKVVVF